MEFWTFYLYLLDGLQYRSASSHPLTHKDMSFRKATTLSYPHISNSEKYYPSTYVQSICCNLL